MMDAQLLSDRPDPPFFNVVKAQNLRLDFRGNGHCDALSYCSGDPGGAAESHGGQTPDRGGRSNGTAIAAGPSGPSSSDPLRPPLSLREANHRSGPAVNPDASHYFFGPGNDETGLRG
jgi:hypothetical protein